MIKEKRLAAGLSRAEASRQLGIPLRTLESWEAGVRRPPEWVQKLVEEKLDQLIADQVNQGKEN